MENTLTLILYLLVGISLVLVLIVAATRRGLLPCCIFSAALTVLSVMFLIEFCGITHFGLLRECRSLKVGMCASALAGISLLSYVFTLVLLNLKVPLVKYSGETEVRSGEEIAPVDNERVEDEIKYDDYKIVT